MSRLDDRALLLRIIKAKRAGFTLKGLARSYGLNYYGLSKEIAKLERETKQKEKSQ